MWVQIKVYLLEIPENDVKASKNAGMKSIWKKDVQWGNVDADFTFDDLVEIPIIIKNLNKFD